MSKKTYFILLAIIISLLAFWLVITVRLFQKEEVCRQNKLKKDYNYLLKNIDSIKVNNDSLLSLMSAMKTETIKKPRKIRILEDTIISKRNALKIKEANNQLTEQDIDTLKKYVSRLGQTIIKTFDSVRIQNRTIAEAEKEVSLLLERIKLKRKDYKRVEKNLDSLLKENFSIKIASIEPVDKYNKEITYSAKPRLIKKFKVTYDVSGCILPFQSEKINIRIYYEEGLIPLGNEDFFYIRSIGTNLTYYIMVPKLSPGSYKICFLPDKETCKGGCRTITIGNS